jgi:hypothetical protein
MRRDLCVDFHTASSDIAAPPIKAATMFGPCVLTIRHKSSGLNRFPNWAVSAPIAELNAGKRASDRVITAIPAAICGMLAATGCAYVTGF